LKYKTFRFTNIDKSINDNGETYKKLYNGLPVKLSSEGKVLFMPTVHLSNECIFSYRKFPFDIQDCDFMVLSIKVSLVLFFFTLNILILLQFQVPYDETKITLTFSTNYTEKYSNHYSVWSIIDTILIRNYDLNHNSIITLRLKLKRQVNNFLYTLPSYIVYVLTLLTFLLPQGSNQRIIIGNFCKFESFFVIKHD
jgi:hypothetical protein